MKRNELLMVATAIMSHRISRSTVSLSSWGDGDGLVRASVKLAKALIEEVNSSVAPTKVTKKRITKKSINRNP